MINYINFFGFQKEPFPQIIDVKKVFLFPGIEEMNARFNFAVDSGMVLVIDEAHLMRESIFREIHTLLQPRMNSDKIMPMILSGQVVLLDKLRYHSANALASRVMGKAHIDGLDLQRMSEYLLHHIKIAGVKNMLYDEASVLAIHQGSGGILRKANLLARGALIAAALKNSKIVSAEHVRLAATEML
jgi:type II secretory pathway predicted ATPase ExeA